MKKIIRRTPATPALSRDPGSRSTELQAPGSDGAGESTQDYAGTARDLLGKSGRGRASLLRRIIIIGLGLVLALFSAALTFSAPTSTPASFGSAALFLQPTETPQPQDLSVIGSTDGIIAMGFVIALIIIIPILLQRKSWMEPR